MKKRSLLYKLIIIFANNCGVLTVVGVILTLWI